MQELDSVKFYEITTNDILVINSKFNLYVDELNRNFFDLKTRQKEYNYLSPELQSLGKVE